MSTTSKACILLGIIGVINIACLFIFSVHIAPFLRSSYKMVRGDIPVTYNTSHDFSTSTTSSEVVLKLREIYQDLNVSATSRVVYPADAIGDYVMLNRSLCRGTDVIDIVIVVHSALHHLERRRRIRETFAREATFLPFHVRVAFLLGRTANRTLEKLLISEHAAHGDSVMADFVDDYHNLTIKGVLGFRWISQHCNNSRFMLEIDDDVLVNTFKLLYTFYGRMPTSRSIFCNLWETNTVKVLRSGKWSVPPNVFRGRIAYPYIYCSGFFNLMSTDLAEPMYQAARIAPFFFISDVYLFGILPYVVGGVTFHNYELGKISSLSGAKTKTCLQTQGPRCSIIASIVSDETFWALWDTIKGVYADYPLSLATKYVV